MKYEYKYLQLEAKNPEEMSEKINELSKGGFELFNVIDVHEVSIEPIMAGNGIIKIIFKAVFRKEITESKECNPHISQPEEINFNIKTDPKKEQDENHHQAEPL